MREKPAGRTLGVSVAAAIALSACRSAGSTAPPEAPSPAPVPSPVATASPAARLFNTLRWKTNDVSNYGYDVYRADSESGPFVKITAQPVPGTLKPGKVQTFEYEDPTIQAGKEYWYYVESISLTGERVRFTPTLKAPAKALPASPSPRD